MKPRRVPQGLVAFSLHPALFRVFSSLPFPGIFSRRFSRSIGKQLFFPASNFFPSSLFSLLPYPFSSPQRGERAGETRGDKRGRVSRTSTPSRGVTYEIGVFVALASSYRSGTIYRLKLASISSMSAETIITNRSDPRCSSTSSLPLSSRIISTSQARACYFSLKRDQMMISRDLRLERIGVDNFHERVK